MSSLQEKQQDVNKGLQDFIFQSKYARWIEDKKRRETWKEATDRVMNMHLNKFSHIDEEHKEKIRWAFSLVENKRVLPSMRSMQFGGKAVDAHNARIFNCSVRHIDSIRSFAEVAYLMLCGCGTGVGLTKEFLGRLPNLVDTNDRTGTVVTYAIEDTIEGWADSLEALLACYFKNTCYSGRKIIFDYSKIRRKGARLKIGGGKAPGYKPLKNALTRIKAVLDHIIEVNGQYKLKPINAYDILMHFADAVLSGGSRRTASSVVFDANDDVMMRSKISYSVKKLIYSIDEEQNTADCKIWVNDAALNQKTYNLTIDLNTDKWVFDNLVQNKEISWLKLEAQRARSNNSILLLRNKLTREDIKNIIEKTQQFGEPGFVFANHPHTLYNPCFEIGFIPVTSDGRCGVQFCNLSTINGTLIKNKAEFLECVEAETIIGTLQASYTSFPYLSNVAQQLTEEEALLGNSLTGIMDSPSILLDESVLQDGAKVAVKVNADWAKILGVNPAARLNAIKPEGTGSLAIGAAPGAHAHHYHKFFRRVQTPKDESIYKFFKEHNPHMCEESVWNTNTKEDVVTFPIKAPEGAMIKDDLTAIKHLEIIKKLQQNWVIPGQVNTAKDVSHNVSCTVIVKDDEWESVIDYLFENKEYFSAVSFIGYYGDKLYKQAPYEKISSDEDEKIYQGYLENYKSVDYTSLFENQDETSLTAESSCAGGACLQ
jgi:ribonucleoside-triphosphate reductase